MVALILITLVLAMVTRFAVPLRFVICLSWLAISAFLLSLVGLGLFFSYTQGAFRGHYPIDPYRLMFYSIALLMLCVAFAAGIIGRKGSKDP